MKKLLAFVLIGSLVFSFAGCKKKEEKPHCRPDIRRWKAECRPQGCRDVPKMDRKVVVPKEVKAKWKAVKLDH